VVHRKKDGGHPSAAIHLRNAIKRMYGYAIELRLERSRCCGGRIRVMSFLGMKCDTPWT